MAVYTEVSDEELSAFLASYDIGTLLSYKGIAEGVENSNYFLHTTKGSYILTLYEKRVREEDLPFFIGLMQHLAMQGLNCPLPVSDPGRRGLGEACGPPGGDLTFLEGVAVAPPERSALLRARHRSGRTPHAGQDFADGPAECAFARRLAAALRAGRGAGRHGLARPRRTDPRGLDFLEGAWPSDLPTGIIHADLFTDNVFFIGPRYRA